MPGKKTGIEERASDTTQPWRVWSQGKIVWFAKTKAEAIRKLNEAGSVHATVRQRESRKNKQY